MRWFKTNSIESTPSHVYVAAVQLDNVLLHDVLDGGPLVRLCDFGSSKLDALNTMCRSYTGTYEYMAPEILFESQVRHCLGVSLCFLSNRCPPAQMRHRVQ